MTKHKLLIQAFAVVAMGGVAQVTTPQASAATAAAYTCLSGWCDSSCPSDLFAFCEPCGHAGGTCSSSGCLGANGRHYDYSVTCINQT
jgi:hypothetical protein